MSDPTRLVMVVRLFDPWTGGMEKQSLTLARALTRLGHQVVILTGRWFPGTPRRQDYGGVGVIRHGALYDGWGVRGLRRLAALVYMATLAGQLWRRRHTFDIIHVHGLSYHAYVAVLIGRLLGKPVVVKLANSGRASDLTKMRTGQHLFLSPLMLGTALRADRFVALSDTIRQELEAAGVPAARIVRIPNGVDIPTRPGVDIPTRPGVDIPTRPPAAQGEGRVLTYVGRLHEQKAVDVLIRAVARLPEGLRRGVRLRLVGEGPARPALEELVERAGLQGRVDFAGVVEDIDGPLGDTDLLVLPSIAEGMSNALLEAMARCVPVVASDIPANAALIGAGGGGWLFPPGDDTELARTLAAVLTDPEVLRAAGERGREVVTRQYSIDAVAERYGRLYAELKAEAS